MENPMGFAHFLAQSDFVARGVLALMLLASIGTWTLIATKGFRLWRVQRQSASFLSAFWAAPNLEAVAARIRENGANEPFSHLVHHGFTAIEQNNRRQRGCQAAGQPLIGRPAGQCADRRFSRPADQQRPAGRQQFALARQQAEVLRHGLAEANAGIQHDAVLFDPQRLQGLRAQL